MTKRYAGYRVQYLDGQDLEEKRFLETHYREAGLAPQKLSGMPQLEAHELVNKWNRDQGRYPRCIFILE